LLSGTNPIITLNPGDVLTAGAVTSGAGLIQYNPTGTGLIDYIYDGNSLPGILPGPLQDGSTYSLDRTLKYNIGFTIVVPTLTVSPVSSSQFQVSWPTSELGWYLQSQTNSLVGNNWVDVPGSSSVTSVNVNIDPNNESVFYRLSSSP